MDSKNLVTCPTGKASDSLNDYIGCECQRVAERSSTVERAWQDSNPRIPSQDTRNILIMIGKLASILIEYEHSIGVQAFLGSLTHLSTEGDEE